MKLDSWRRSEGVGPGDGGGGEGGAGRVWARGRFVSKKFTQ